MGALGGGAGEIGELELHDERADGAVGVLSGEVLADAFEHAEHDGLERGEGLDVLGKGVLA